MSFNTLSAVLRGRWLLDKQWAESHYPLVLRFMKGETIDFGIGDRKLYKDGEEVENTPPKAEKLSAQRNVYSVKRYSDLSTLPNGSIAMLTLEGPLMKRGGICSYGMVDHAELINRLSVASNVGGILLNIDSPGGQADGTAMLAQVIKEASAKKPVLAIIDDGMAASAAMWIASAADEIYVTQPTDAVGSVGVYTTIADWNAHYKEYFKLPVKDVYAPQSTDKNRDYYEALAGNEEPLKEDLAVLAQQFIDTVSINRSGKIKGNEWKSGKMFYAKDAKRIGLIDGVKSFSQVVNRLDNLISSRSQNSQNKNMAFEKTLATAKAESFVVTDDGFALQETDLNNIEAALIAADKTAETLSAAQTRIAELEELSGTQSTAVSDAATELAAANETINTQEARITELENQVKELGKQPSGSGTILTITQDDHASKPSWLVDDGSKKLAETYVK